MVRSSSSVGRSWGGWAERSDEAPRWGGGDDDDDEFDYSNVPTLGAGSQENRSEPMSAAQQVDLLAPAARALLALRAPRCSSVNPSVRTNGCARSARAGKPEGTFRAVDVGPKRVVRFTRSESSGLKSDSKKLIK